MQALQELLASDRKDSKSLESVELLYRTGALTAASLDDWQASSRVFFSPQLNPDPRIKLRGSMSPAHLVSQRRRRERIKATGLRVM